MALLRLFFASYLLVIRYTSADYSFILYNTDNPGGTTDLYQSKSTLPTYFIVHGWLQSNLQPWVLQMKDAYLAVASANVITFNWAPYSENQNYIISSLAVSPAGKVLGAKIVELSSAEKINISTTELIGFSLGAHVSGVAGEFFKFTTNNLLEVIVGLDAPLLGFAFDVGRLSTSDAKFVQAFHTSSFGKLENYGHVDVYFNYYSFVWGIIQTNCPSNPGVTVPATFNSDFCNHLRSVAYWIETITNNQCLAVKCTCWVNQVNTCGNVGVLIGHDMNTALTGKYCLKTNGVSPFGKGASGL